MNNNFYTPNDTVKALSLLNGYFDAAKWTEDLTVEKVQKESWNKSYNDCFKFVRSILESEEYKKASFTMDWTNQELVDSMGHDLWLTRNGHGSGFWDRPELWGDCADLFSDLARKLGTVYASEESNVLILDSGV